MENKKAETNEMKYLIVGLGNIGPEYHETRHNIGFMVVDELAKKAEKQRLINLVYEFSNPQMEMKKSTQKIF